MIPILCTLLMIVIVIAGVMRIVQSFSSDVIQLLVERSLMVLAAGGIEPLLQSWLAGVTPEREHGSFFGWAACFKSVGWMLGALSGGFTASLLGGVRGVFFGEVRLENCHAGIHGARRREYLRDIHLVVFEFFTQEVHSAQKPVV